MVLGTSESECGGKILLLFLPLREEQAGQPWSQRASALLLWLPHLQITLGLPCRLRHAVATWPESTMPTPGAGSQLTAMWSLAWKAASSSLGMTAHELLADVLTRHVLGTGGGGVSLVPVAESHLEVGGLLWASCQQPRVGKSGNARECNHGRQGMRHLALQRNSSALSYEAELPISPDHGSACRDTALWARCEIEGVPSSQALPS